MSVKQLDPFRLTFYQVSIKNWKEKKKKLLDLVDWNDVNCLTQEHFTDYYKNMRNPDQRASYTDDFVKILKEDLITFTQSVEKSEMNRFRRTFNMKVTNLWAQRYKSQNFMPPHTHEPAGFSAVLFAEFDNTEHQATKFWAPFKNTIDAMDYRYDPDVKEGDILFFPSFLMHYAEPNYSEKNRTIFSFNSYVRPIR